MNTFKKYILLGIEGYLKSIVGPSDSILSKDIGENNSCFQIKIKDGTYSKGSINNIKIITNVAFIDSITKIIWNKKPYGMSKRTKTKFVWDDSGQVLYDKITDLKNDLTIKQAIAIRDDRLEEWINNTFTILFSKK